MESTILIVNGVPVMSIRENGHMQVLPWKVSLPTWLDWQEASFAPIFWLASVPKNQYVWIDVNRNAVLVWETGEVEFVPESETKNTFRWLRDRFEQYARIKEYYDITTREDTKAVVQYCPSCGNYRALNCDQGILCPACQTCDDESGPSGEVFSFGWRSCANCGKVLLGLGLTNQRLVTEMCDLTSGCSKNHDKTGDISK